jgi:hypothetical protein
MNSDYVHDLAPGGSWSPCGEFWILNLESDIKVSASGNAGGEIMDDSFEEAIEYQFALQWNACV